MTAYVLAVWFEEDKDIEGVVPRTWVDEEKKVLFWPTQNKNSTVYIKNKKAPEKDKWKQFSLIKVKFSSGM